MAGQFTDPYEEWKQNGRPGGTYTPPAPTPTPVAPTPPTTGAPPPPPPRPPRYGGSEYNGGQIQPEENQRQISNVPAPYRPPQPGPPPPPPPPAPTRFDQNMQVFNATPDYKDTNVGQAQWDAWTAEEKGKTGQANANTAINKYNPDGQGCPPNLPYTSRVGADGKVECAAKPDDCPEGQHVEGTPGRCVPNGTGHEAPGAFGGGAGGAGGQGGSGGAGGGGLDAMTEYWRNLMMQSGSRYTPEAMAKMEGDQFSRARAQEKLQLDAAKQDMAQRGTSRSANQNAAVRQIGVGTGQQIMANNADLAKRKIEADYQDKQAAIKNAQDWVNSMRDYMLRTDMNAIQREQIAAQIRLAQMNITQQTQMLEQQYQNSLGLMVAGGGLS